MNLDVEDFSGKCSKIEQSFQTNCVLQELNLILLCTSGFRMSSSRNLQEDVSELIKNVIDGVTPNRILKSFSFILIRRKLFFGSSCIRNFDISAAVIDLLKDNSTLKALRLHFPKPLWNSKSILNTIEIKTPLNAVDINTYDLITKLEAVDISTSDQITKLIFQNCTETLHYMNFELDQHNHCLSPYRPSKMFQSSNCLQQISLALHTTEPRTTIELFSELKFNRTLTDLQVTIENNLLANDNVGCSLQDLLKMNNDCN